MREIATGYDQIADVYATDMGGNIGLSDLAYFEAICRRKRGRVLEVGCGTGRLLLPLREAGIDVFGIDLSSAMLDVLRRSARASGQNAPVACMDARRMGFDGPFASVIAPFSMVTYLVDRTDIDAFLGQCRSILALDGRLVIDAFIPRDVSAFADLRLDYERPFEGLSLRRSRRIAPLGGGINRIERHYEIRDGSVPVRTWTTVETIRPYAPPELTEAAAAAGFELEALHFDYQLAAPMDPSFYTVVLKLR